MYIPTIINNFIRSNIKHMYKSFDISFRAGVGGNDAIDINNIILDTYCKMLNILKINIILVQNTIKIRNTNNDILYGLLSIFDNGCIRVIRISPFTKKRQTSIISITVIPVNENKINIHSKDIKVETFRASGHGGQHVNKTNSAARVTHLPTMISVKYSKSRDQYSNIKCAKDILYTKLNDIENIKISNKNQDYKLNNNPIFGNHNKTIVLYPNKYIKINDVFAYEIKDLKDINITFLGILKLEDSIINSILLSILK